MAALFPVSSSRVSDLLLRKRLASQFETDRIALLSLQDRISTGIRLSKPSDDSPAAMRAITLQRLLEQKEQIKTNLSISESYVAATDNSLSTVSSRLADIRGRSPGIVDTTTSANQRDIMIQELQQTLRGLVEKGNHQFRGRYLFASSKTSERPFEISGNYVVYRGNEQSLSSYVDVDFLAPTNVDGNSVFGAISSAVPGSTDLQPALPETTLLSSLHGGRGISKGSILVSDGDSSSLIDLSAAETVQDVIRLIETNPPAGRQIIVRVQGGGLRVDLDDAGGGNLTIRDAPAGTTASELGIRNEEGAGVAVLEGQDINPRLGPTSPLANLLGTRASAFLESSTPNADILVQAADNGVEFNDIVVRFVEVSAAGDQAFAAYDSITKELVIDINGGTTTANTVVSAINATGIFTANFDNKRFVANDGTGIVQLSSTATTSGGTGFVLDQTSGLQVVNGGETHVISFKDAETVEDLLNALNHSPAELLAEINETGTGIDICSRLSGSDFQIGENGGTTATELGVRTLTLATRLDKLNFGRGVNVAPGTDFIIQRKDGVQLEIDLSASETVADVISAISLHPDNAGASVTARLAQFGNGIELYDENELGAGSLTVTRAQSFAAWDLGFVERRSDESTGTASTIATARLSFPLSPLDSAIELIAAVGGYELNDVEVEVVDTRSGDVADVTFDPTAKRLTVNIDASLTTANTIVSAVNADATFTAALDLVSDPTNDGTGVVATTGVLATTNGGADERILGRDVNPHETKGVFNSLIRLSDAVESFDIVEIERGVAMLDDDFDRVNFSRADIGALGRSLDVIQRRVEDEEVEMRSALSSEIDTDFVQSISDLTARQAGNASADWEGAAIDGTRFPVDEAL